MDAKPTLVRQVMTACPEMIDAHETLQRAAERMRSENIGILVVRDPVVGAVGMISDRDITVRATAAGLDPVRTEVQQAMTAQVITCLEGEELGEAARIMERASVRRLVVLNDARQVVGLLSVDDVARAIGGAGLAGDVLRESTEHA